MKHDPKQPPLLPTPTLLELEAEPVKTPVAPRLQRRTMTTSSDFVRARAAEAMARRQEQQASVVLQQELTLWSDELRGVPSPMVRSGLFGTKSNGAREAFEEQVVVSLSNIEMLYTGKELLQDDLSVWMSLMNLAAQQRIGDSVFFSGYQLVKDLGWAINSVSYKRAKECIARLKANEIKIQVRGGKRGYSGSLIREYEWDAKDDQGGTAAWMVRIEPRIADLFQEDSTTYVEWEQRKKIGSRAGLTLWLHSFYTSHRDPHPISISKLHELCRSEQKDIRFFRRRVKVALQTLVEIGLLTQFAVSAGDLVSVKKAPLRITALKRIASKRLC